MAALNFLHLMALAALALLVILGMVWARHRRRKLPVDREQERRLEVNTSGRLTDGVLLESPYDQPPSQTSELLFYRYSAAGVEYTAAQDVSTLSDRIPSDSCRPGSITGVKYDPRRPSNSIVICEQWSGLSNDRAGAARAN